MTFSKIFKKKNVIIFFCVYTSYFLELRFVYKIKAPRHIEITYLQSTKRTEPKNRWQSVCFDVNIVQIYC